MKLSVVIVNYNVRYFLEQCLRSVFKASAGMQAEVIVVDNSSVDGSVEMLKAQFPSVKVIANKENLGFARANNIGIRQARGRYILLLNPDTVIEEDTLKKTTAFMDATPDAGGLGVYMIDGKGHFLPESKRSLPTPWVAFFKIFALSALFPKSRLFGKYHLGYLDENKIHSVDVLSGAFMLLRSSVLDKTGFLDEDFFMYGEDIDLSYRILQAGYKNYYFPKTRIIHYKGESTKKSSINYVLMFYRAMVIFANKHFSRKNARVLYFFIQIAIWIRASIALANRILQSVFLPLLDFSGFCAGLYLLRQQYSLHTGIIYDDMLVNIAFPVYSLIWVAGIWFAGGYKKPVHLIRTIPGLLAGTALILTVYALLSESYRFSRALILLGMVWTMMFSLMVRMLLHFINWGSFRIGGNIKKRFAIVGEQNERERVASILKQTHFDTDLIVNVSTEEGKEETSPAYVAKLHQLHDVIRIFHIDEVIFCANSMDAVEIINQMSFQRGSDVEFKIAPPESLYIIGSGSIKSGGELYYVMDVHALVRPEKKRAKRMFDLAASLLLLCLSPGCIFFMEKPLGFLSNILAVISGKKTWVGLSDRKKGKKSPLLKPGVLTPSDAISGSKITDEAQVDLLYARDYRVSKDIEIICRAFNKLGNN